MDAASIHERLRANFGAEVIGDLVAETPDPYVIVDADKIAVIAYFMKTESGFDFNFLESITGVDTGEKLQVVYHLFSYTHRHAFVLKTERPYDQAQVPSVAKVWAAAEWLEREQFDLMGIEFTGHRDLRRLLLPDDWVGHPLRKNYVYPEAYHGIDHYRPDPKDQFRARDERLVALGSHPEGEAREGEAREGGAAEGGAAEGGAAEGGAAEGGAAEGETREGEAREDEG